MKIDKFRGEFGFLSNMSECEVQVGGITFNSVEQAYQFHKTSSPTERDKILKAKTPKDSKLISKRFKKVRSDWHEVKDKIMYELVKIKFTDNDDYREALCLTKGVELIEGNWWGDHYWGVCNGVGKNKLGKILMRVRDEVCTN